ncbi:hypothetical protein NP493_23g00044 [Ridgeia piscesae]|uniref:Uncharacterized protein n=1 Tax=Ridgeia piscesae TaxID=27915 RepID=A0AAD9PDM1_RIDPI|nr:hypothetical protein NP493_23g00044 [Ridgeia piscesae]
MAKNLASSDGWRVSLLLSQSRSLGRRRSPPDTDRQKRRLRSSDGTITSRVTRSSSNSSTKRSGFVVTRCPSITSGISFRRQLKISTIESTNNSDVLKHPTSSSPNGMSVHCQHSLFMAVL